MGSKFDRAVYVVAGIIFVIWVTSALPNMGSQTRIDEVYVGVMYDRPWQGAIGDLGSVTSWGAKRSYTRLFIRPQDTSMWIISANAQKKDDSNRKLTIMIWYADKNGDPVTLAEASTSQQYGIAQVSCEIKKP